MWFLFFKIYYLFIYGCVGSSLPCAGFLLWWLLLLRSTGSRRVGFSSCGTWAQQLWLAGSRAQSQQLWCTGLVAPRHVGSSWTRARTRAPCIGRRILNHCATREALMWILEKSKKKKGTILIFRRFVFISYLSVLQYYRTFALCS